jgi:hypothetical protein
VPGTGAIEVCNEAYGNNGWLGLAQIWTSGNHIVRGYTKVNDSYFDYAPYNTNAWRQMVMCQEVGHDFGLDHQDENKANANLGSCMDYTRDPSTNMNPNAHDFEQLELMYNHLDSTSTVNLAACSGGDSGGDTKPCRGRGCGLRILAPLDDEVDGGDHHESPNSWGTLVSDGARSSTYEAELGVGPDGASLKKITHVTWALDSGPSKGGRPDHDHEEEHDP